MATIAKACGISRTTVKRKIEELVQKGWLIKEHRIKPSGSYTSNIYKLTHPSEVFKDGQKARSKNNELNKPLNKKTREDDTLSSKKKSSGLLESPPKNSKTEGGIREDLPTGIDSQMGGSQRSLPEGSTPPKDINRNSPKSLECTGGSPGSPPATPNGGLREDLPIEIKPQRGGAQESLPVSVDFEEGGPLESPLPSKEVGDPRAQVGRSMPHLWSQATSNNNHITIPENTNIDSDHLLSKVNNKKKVLSETLPKKNTVEITNRDLIADLGDELVEYGMSSRRAYGIAGRLYNQYDYIPALKAIHALNKKGQIDNPIPYLMAVAKAESQKLITQQQEEEQEDEQIEEARRFHDESKATRERLYQENIEKVREIYALQNSHIGDLSNAPRGLKTPRFLLEGGK